MQGRLYLAGTALAQAGKPIEQAVSTADSTPVSDHALDAVKGRQLENDGSVVMPPGVNDVTETLMPEASAGTLTTSGIETVGSDSGPTFRAPGGFPAVGVRARSGRF